MRSRCARFRSRLNFGARTLVRDSQKDCRACCSRIVAVPDLAPEHRNKAKVAETHNSLGALAQKQRKYAESEAAYVKSLEVRQSLKPSTDREQQARARTSSHAIDPTERTHAHAPRRPVGSASVHAHPLHANLSTAMRGQEKDQALAQSYTSLGNLFSEMGELARALEQLQLAKECYVKGARSPAPPLRARRWAAWAATLEGHQTSMGSLVAARYARVPPRSLRLLLSDVVQASTRRIRRWRGRSRRWRPSIRRCTRIASRRCVDASSERRAARPLLHPRWHPTLALTTIASPWWAR